MRRLLPDPAVEVDLDEAYAAGSSAHVRATMVASADGASSVHGRSGGLSGAADRRVLSVLRGLADVVLVGAGTVRAEKYGPVRPTAERRARRRAAGLGEVPPIAVVTSRLDLDPAAPFFTAAEARPLLVTVEAADARPFAAVADVVTAGETELDHVAAVAALAARGLTRVLTEGGPRVLGTLLAAGLLDELCLTTSPLLTGGDAPRITAGARLPAPARLALLHLLEQDGYLFARYAVSSSAAVPAPPGSP